MKPPHGSGTRGALPVIGAVLAYLKCRWCIDLQCQQNANQVFALLYLNVMASARHIHGESIIKRMEVER
jgi:hypothetical protein